jgi:uncharacterized protein YcbK (DUF882 family)
MLLSKNFTYEELTKSNTASRLKINNSPDDEVKAKLKKLANDVLQPIRDAYGKPIKVSSGYRCLKLNEKVGGAVNSQHVKGEAADITTISDTVDENKVLFEVIKKLIKGGKIVVGQLIDEYGYNWVHVSLPNDKHKNQILHLKK